MVFWMNYTKPVHHYFMRLIVILIYPDFSAFLYSMTTFDLGIHKMPRMTVSNN
jgi:hypothetical protein